MVNCLAILSFTVAHLGLSLNNNTLSGTVFNALCRQCGNVCLQMWGLMVQSFNKRQMLMHLKMNILGQTSFLVHKCVQRLHFLQSRAAPVWFSWLPWRDGFITTLEGDLRTCPMLLTVITALHRGLKGLFTLQRHTQSYLRPYTYSHTASYWPGHVRVQCRKSHGCLKSSAMKDEKEGLLFSLKRAGLIGTTVCASVSLNRQSNCDRTKLMSLMTK